MDSQPEFYVRIEFMWQGERVWDNVGPFDRYFAMLTCVSMSEPWTFGITDVHILSAKIQHESEVEW